jgi:hypothetical protein
MLPAPAPGHRAGRVVAEQFLDLVCHDPELLAAAFDEIIAATWPDPPASRPDHGPTRWRPIDRANRWLTVRDLGPVFRPRYPGVIGWTRQRSPPVR